MIRVIVSAGQGKLHFHESAKAVANAGADVGFLTGWLPSKRQRFLADLIGGMLGERHLASRLEARAVQGHNLKVFSNAWVEFLGQGISLLSRMHLISEDVASTLAFTMSGFAARRYLAGADIFHVRSGAGQGGAIRTAKEAGLRVLTDHSIAHPAYMEKVLAEEYARSLVPALNSASDFWKLILKDCCEADLLLANSDYVKDTFVAYGYPSDRIRVAYLGVNSRFFGLKTNYEIRGPINLLFTGNFEVRKGVRTLLESIRKLRAGGLDLRLNFIGNLTNGRIWLKESDYDFFRHSPFVAPEELAPTLAKADMFVFPTLSEGSSRSAMEAAAAGIPVITTANCGLPLVNGDSVFYVPINDTEALTSAISMFAASEDLRKKLGANASRFVMENYTWASYGKTVLRIYEEMLGRSFRPH